MYVSIKQSTSSGKKMMTIFFDVNKTKRNISVFHSDVEETLVVMRGVITDKNGKKIKGKNWEIHESERTQDENLDIFKSVLKIFHLENPKHKPASESFVTSVKRTMG